MDFHSRRGIDILNQCVGMRTPEKFNDQTVRRQDILCVNRLPGNNGFPVLFADTVIHDVQCLRVLL